ncbi:MAG: hypothetical protein Q8Q49_05205 [bacterium]|nr:hypothetical protein [bacterium]
MQDNTTGTPQKNHVITPKSTLSFYNLQYRLENGEYVVWRIGDDDFYVLPEEGKRAIELLKTGMPVEKVQKILDEEYDAQIDLTGFITSLLNTNLLSAFDGYDLPEKTYKKNSLPWITKTHAGWFLSKYALMLYGIVFFAGIGTLISHIPLFPQWSDFFWAPSTSLVLLVNICIGFGFVALHELAHLFTARALGIPGRISFGTRLHYLVMQTDVTGIWSAPKNKRYIVYLSGIFCNLLFASVFIILLSYIPFSPLITGILKMALLTNILVIVGEFELYMRTDLYFVLMDFLRCRNLFHDSLSYARYVLNRMIGFTGLRKRKLNNPLLHLPHHERRSIQVYSLIAVIGSIVSLGIFAFYSVPIALRLYETAVISLVSGYSEGKLIHFIDGSVTLLVEVLFIGLYIYAFVKNHPRIIAFVTANVLPFRKRR